MDSSLSRRRFLAHGAGGLSAVWISAHWPALLAAATHAHQTAKSAVPPKFEFFSAEEAKEIEAIAARIIPSDNTPGAREAGIVFFIDRALVTFSRDDQKKYRDGLRNLQARLQELFPGSQKFSHATPEQQDEVLRSFEEQVHPALGWDLYPKSPSFFETIRAHTITGFLIDPDSGGNQRGAGWKVIGRDPAHMFQPPFGYYDKGYPGWESGAKEAEKK
jgi:gluconate 2-dehydrogenase subunit 3-like protein